MSPDEEEIPIHEIEKRLDHPITAMLTISGTKLAIGHLSDMGTGSHDSLYLFIPDEQAEPTYFSVDEAEMIISALRATISRLKGDY